MKNKNIILILPSFILILFVLIIPMFSMLKTSLYISPFGENGDFIGFKNYIRVLDDSGMSMAVKISFIWSSLISSLMIILGIVIAYLIENKQKNKKILFSLIMIPWIIPSYMGVLIWRSLIYGYGTDSIIKNIFHLNTDIFTNVLSGFGWGVFVSIWLELPIVVMVLIAAFQEVPKELQLAAKIDGANSLNTLVNINIPYIKPTIITWFLITFANHFKDFTVPFLLTAGGPPLFEGFTSHSIVGITTTMGIFNYFISNTQYDFGIISAYSVVSAVFVMLIAFIFLTRRTLSLKKFITFVIAIKVLSYIFNPNISLLISGLLYLILLRKRNLFGIVVLFDFLIMIFNIKYNGFWNGFDFIPIISLIWLIFKEKTPVIPQINKLNSLKYMKYVFFAVFLLIILLPVYNIINISFSGTNNIIMTLFPEKITIDNYVKIFSDLHIEQNLKNTIIIALLTAIMVPVISYPLAMYISKKTLRWVLPVLIFLDFLGGVHSIIALFMVFKKLNLLNSLFGVSLVYTTHTLPMATFLIKGYIDKIPKEIEETAILDTTKIKSYFYIIFPLTIPAILVSSLIGFMKGWNGFIPSLMLLSKDSLYPLSVKLYTLIGEPGTSYPRWDLFSAASILNILFLGIIFIMIRKPLMNGVLKNSY
ncbi:ABC-type maltose transport system, permease component [Marinitoga hydrogenitolerans DSM 16785]|uniref:ABC-type maltose transport system, permease component n=1 Tax=Marinitoga hydrogenitolerans (strain DSM 16785 / JCM 12826 / AT1271) TaxID=1122195 RepID=A0A1M4YD74_MARH1|nr:ABC transporter permease subunit [Marinitoga hydrogenitolerans]SHF03558.1 ABC-type maltose transport system, permease component [Marinitoga hydrogenitolerans DSM 16785]